MTAQRRTRSPSRSIRATGTSTSLGESDHCERHTRCYIIKLDVERERRKDGGKQETREKKAGGRGAKGKGRKEIRVKNVMLRHLLKQQYKR